MLLLDTQKHDFRKVLILGLIDIFAEFWGSSLAVIYRYLFYLWAGMRSQRPRRVE